MGYDWIGDTTKFPSDAEYVYAVEGSTPKALSAVASGTLASTTGTWNRKTTTALSLGILPVFHS
jgi:sensor c-di-GMP phosphodiesterase-like protein